MTSFPALPLLATNPGDATVCSQWDDGAAMLLQPELYSGKLHRGGEIRYILFEVNCWLHCRIMLQLYLCLCLRTSPAEAKMTTT